MKASSPVLSAAAASKALQEGPEWVVARSPAEAAVKLSDALGAAVKEEDIEQDEDVLDTWFSSAL